MCQKIKYTSPIGFLVNYCKAIWDRDDIESFKSNLQFILSRTEQFVDIFQKEQGLTPVQTLTVLATATRIVHTL